MSIQKLLRMGILAGFGLGVMATLSLPMAAEAQNVRVYEPQIDWTAQQSEALNQTDWFNANAKKVGPVHTRDWYRLNQDIVITEGDGAMDVRPHLAVGPPQRLSINMFNSMDVPARVIIPDLEISFLVLPNTIRNYQMSMLQVGNHRFIPYIIEPLEAPQVAMVEGSILDMIDTDTSYVVETDPEPVYRIPPAQEAVRGYW